MLTVAGRGEHGEDLIEGYAGLQLAADDVGLALDAAESRDDMQSDAVPLGGGAQLSPGSWSNASTRLVCTGLEITQLRGLALG
jgi:hypothetical protein